MLELFCKDSHIFWFRAHFYVPLRYNFKKKMNFFRKKDKNSVVSTPQAEVNPQASSVQPLSTPKDDPAVSTPMSQVEIERKIREEAKRLRLTEHILSEPQLQRVQEALRLNETKLANVEENLMRTRTQKDRLHRFKELQGEMESQRAHLFAVNKQAASLLGDKKELERFETFENVQGRFQRLQILERQRSAQKMHESELVGDIENLQREFEDENKRLKQCADETANSEKLLNLGQAAIYNGIKLEGQNDAYAYVRQKVSEISSRLTNKYYALEKEIQELGSTIDTLKSDMEKKRTRLQSTDVHQRMVKHSELAIEQLTSMNSLLEKMANNEAEIKEAERKQRTENDLLGRVFSDYQQVLAQINTTTDELSVHRQSIHGQDSYGLQERAMNLKRRRQMLQSAQALWRRINTLYTLIESKQQEINSLRLTQEHTADSLRKMEDEIGILRRSYQEKEYTFTLSKSQNVIQLRGDLKEGVNCTVCGATHHPYHSDTMLEQNKLIAELKTEAEMLRTELRNKENELLGTKLSLEHNTASKKAAENELINLRSIQNEAVKDWAMFSELDSSFYSCDSTTNSEARTAMLRQLIENCETDVRKAQEELDTYNFHQTRINELTETMSRHEQVRNDLTTRMNEVNTGCQVIAREVDWLASRRQELNDSYGRLFETLEKHITIPDWQNMLKRGLESITMLIQEITNERQQLSESLSTNEAQLQVESATLKQKQEQLDELQQQLLANQNTLNDLSNLTEGNNKELERLLQGMDSKQYREILLNQYLEDRQKAEHQREKTDSKKESCLQAKGKLDELRQTANATDNMAAQERSALDIWMRQYNATHSPVQYSELEQFFQVDRDWTTIREQIRSIDLESKLTQAKVDHLRGQMVALQAEGNIPDGDTTEALLTLAKQEEVLEKRRGDAMLLIATNTLTLQAHEKADNQVKGEKMREPGV